MLGDLTWCGVRENEVSVWVGDGSGMVGEGGVSRSDGSSAGSAQEDCELRLGTNTGAAADKTEVGDS